ncbi:MAG TPA: 3-hydroxyacyl-CoA dehydrogenase NAD-binding domain-containing protein [Gammaproteobacteria bacterium]
MAAPPLEHWVVETDSVGICWLTLDKADSGSNTLSQDVLTELERVLDAAVGGKPPAGLVIRSAKSSGFILGADVGEFGALHTALQGTQAAARGQHLMARIAALDFPTVALINGFALGGGLELALACDYRVAARGYERTLGLPEIQLGIHPGFGGTVRAVELLGAPLALDLMLTGRQLSPSEALQAGLVDRVVEPQAMREAAAALIAARPRRRRAPWYLRLLRYAPVRALIANRAHARVARRASAEHYPAPFAIIDLWRRYGAHGEAAYRAEVESIGRLLVTATCRNLVRVFHLRERLRNLAPRTSTVQRVHVVGAGVMGGDIAAWCALRGMDVTLQDRAMEYITPALERARKLFASRLKAPGAAADADARLQADLEGAGAGAADLVVEAIIENLEAKASLFRGLEPKLKADAVVATNTSSIRIEDIAPVFTAPQRFIGLHFFNPVAQLPLVEVVRGPATGEETFRRALSFVIQIGKLPLPCRSSPGFLVNRILLPYMLEALRAHEDGHALETIDAAATSFGMPMGPIELADRVGLDIARHVADILGAVYGGAVPKLLAAKVDSRKLGVKSGEGFYRYVEGRPQKRRDHPRPSPDLEDRLMLPLVNEAVACLAERIVADADLLDAGVVFGTGFAPFRGGPINYARQRGVETLVHRLEQLAEQFGPRFAPHAGWRLLAVPA